MGSLSQGKGELIGGKRKGGRGKPSISAETEVVNIGGFLLQAGSFSSKRAFSPC